MIIINLSEINSATEKLTEMLRNDQMDTLPEPSEEPVNSVMPTEVGLGLETLEDLTPVDNNKKQATYWALTWFPEKVGYSVQLNDLNKLAEEIENWLKAMRYFQEFAFQFEETKKEKTHLQAHVGFFRSREAFVSFRKLFPGAHISIVRNRWNHVSYCVKEDTRVAGFIPRVFGIDESKIGKYKKRESAAPPVKETKAPRSKADLDGAIEWAKQNIKFNIYKVPEFAAFVMSNPTFPVGEPPIPRARPGLRIRRVGGVEQVTGVAPPDSV